MDGVERILAERRRQLRKGWSIEHDSHHQYGDLVVQAATIAVDGTDAIVIDEFGRGTPTADNDWEGDSWHILEKWKQKESDQRLRRIRLLSIAGALIAAEIDRILANEGELKP